MPHKQINDQELINLPILFIKSFTHPSSQRLYSIDVSSQDYILLILICLHPNFQFPILENYLHCYNIFLLLHRSGWSSHPICITYGLSNGCYSWMIPFTPDNRFYIYVYTDRPRRSIRSYKPNPKYLGWACT